MLRLFKICLRYPDNQSYFKDVLTSPNHVFDFMPCKVKLNLRDGNPSPLSQWKCKQL